MRKVIVTLGPSVWCLAGLLLVALGSTWGTGLVGLSMIVWGVFDGFMSAVV